MRSELDGLKHQLIGFDLKTNSGENELKELEQKLKSL